jgi:hypothetical protein
MEFTRCIRYRIVLDTAPEALVETVKHISGVRGLTMQEAVRGTELAVELERDSDGVSGLLAAIGASGVYVLSLRSENPQPLDVFIGLTHDDGST